MTTYEWCDWIPDAVNSDPLIKGRTIYLDGWENRGRPGSFFPTGLVEHHTACMIRLGHDPQTDINVNIQGNSIAPGPISQFLITWTPPGVKWNGHNADPRLIIVAAGRANHAGASSYSWGAPGGNGSTVGNECCGPSEEFPWPDNVIEFRARWSAAVLRTNGWGTDKLTTHWECAEPEGRKIDPSGPWVDEPNLKWNQHWSPNKWRQRVSGLIVPVTPPTTPPVVVNPNPSKESTLSMRIIQAADNLPADQDFAAWFYGQVDQNGIAHFIEWTGEGGRAEVQQRLREEVAAGATPLKVGLGSLKNCVLIGDMPPDGTDIKHAWRKSDFAKVVS